MRFEPALQAGDKLTFGQLRGIFQCPNAGGVLYTKKYNTLVIVSNHTKGIADDKWVGNILHYTGMGMNGDQILDGNHNKILSESNTNGVTVHLFEVYVQHEYIYRGIVKLVQEPYQEFRKDQEGNIRRVWVFPVRVTGNAKEEDEAEEYRLFDRISRIEDEEIQQIEMTYQRTPVKKEKPIFRNGTEVYLPKTEKALNALFHARFQCETDAEHWIPDKEKSIYKLAEPHHLVPLRYSGEFKYSLDVEENIVSLCPACHRQLYHGQGKEDVLRKLYEDRKELLKSAGIEITWERLLAMYTD